MEIQNQDRNDEGRFSTATTTIANNDDDNKNKKKSFLRTLLVRFVQLFKFKNRPFFAYYSYLWRKNRFLLIQTFLCNYAIVFLQFLPWFLSKRALQRKLRTARIKLNHNMVTANTLKWRLLQDFVRKGLLFSLIDSVMHMAASYVKEQNKLCVRRLVMERVLYTEVSQFRQIKHEGNLEMKVTKEIVTSLNFLNSTLPSLLEGAFAFISDGSRLYRKRARIDWLALLYPVVTHSVHRVVTYIQKILYKRRKKKQTVRHEHEISTYMGDAMQRLIDIQTNNLQQIQLRAFDLTTSNHLLTKYGWRTLPLRSFTRLQQMSFISYVFEVWCVHRIMKRRSMNYAEYSKLQQEIETFVNICRRLLQVFREAIQLYGSKDKVVQQWSTLPNWKDSDQRLYSLQDIIQLSLTTSIEGITFNLHSLVLSNVMFTYENQSKQTLMTGYVPPALYLGKDLIFEARMSYGLVGGRSGTALALLVCKIYNPMGGTLLLNGIPYSKISRTALRSIITYATRNPLICEGSIRENLLLFNPTATEEELVMALKYVGIHHFTDQESDDDFTSPPRNKKFKKLLKSKRNKRKGHKVKQKNSKSSFTDALEGSASYSDFRSLVSPHGNVYRDSTSTHFPAVINDSNEMLNEYSAIGNESYGLSVSSTDSDSNAEAEGSDDDDDGDDDDDDDDAAVVSEGMLKSVSSPDLLMEDNTYKMRRLSMREAKAKGSGVGWEEETEGGQEASEKELRGLLNEIVDRNIPKGLAQAIGLARVFLRPFAKILILDKATSEMNQLKLRKCVFPNLLKFIKDNGICLIAITPDTSPDITLLHQLDMIYVFDQGSIVHQGTHNQLIQQNATKYREYMFPWKTNDSPQSKRHS